MAGPRTTWVDKTTDETSGPGREAERDNSAGKLNHTRETTMEHLTPNSRSTGILQPTDEGLQTATRLKILLEAGRVAAFAGLTPDDGATPLLIQVGAALASIDSAPVLLIDANSLAPRLHQLLEVSQSPGLMECLEGCSTLNAAIRTTAVSNLSVLPFGKSSSNLSQRLNASDTERVFPLIRERYRYILVDAGVIFQTSEGMMISVISDGVVIAAAAGKRRQHEILQCREGLEQLKLRLLGIVLTRNAPRS